MRVKSLKFRLTFLYFISFFIATAIIFTSFYFTTRQTLYNHTDSLISAHSNQMKEIVISDSNSVHTTLDESVLSGQFGEMPGMIVAITDSSGEIVGGSSISFRSKSIFTQFFIESIRGDKPRFENINFGGSHMRFMVTPVYQDYTFLGTLIVGHPIGVIENSLKTLVWELIILFSILSVAGMAGGYFIAKQALLPVRNISNKMRSISHKNLDDRVENPKTQDEMQELAITFNNLLDRLNSAFNREHQFIGDVAHELKTPLSILKSRIEVVLSRERSNENYKEDLAETLKDVNNLDSIIKDILDLAWSESDNAFAQMDKLNLSETTKEIIDTAKSIASQKKISIQSQVEPDIYILGKKDKISRAMINIIDNATKYTARNGKISLKLKTDGRIAILKLKDNGIGINEEDQKHIFDRFYRGSTKKKISGNGLGLAIVKSIIFAHQGTVRAVSKQNQGTEIIITLPLFN